MTNQEFAEECRQRRIDYDKLFTPRETPAWMRSAEEELKRGAAIAVRNAVRGTARQFIADPRLLGRVDRLLPNLDYGVALQRVVDLRAQFKRPSTLKGAHETVNLVAAERALRILIRLKRRWEWRRAAMEEAYNAGA